MEGWRSKMVKKPDIRQEFEDLLTEFIGKHHLSPPEAAGLLLSFAGVCLQATMAEGWPKQEAKRNL